MCEHLMLHSEKINTWNNIPIRLCGVYNLARETRENGGRRAAARGGGNYTITTAEASQIFLVRGLASICRQIKIERSLANKWSVSVVLSEAMPPPPPPPPGFGARENIVPEAIRSAS